MFMVKPLTEMLLALNGNHGVIHFVARGINKSRRLVFTNKRNLGIDPKSLDVGR